MTPRTLTAAGAVLVLTAALTGCADVEAAKQREAELRAQLESQIASARKDAERAQQSVAGVRDDLRRLREDHDALTARVTELEARPEAAPAAAAPADAAAAATKPKPDRKALLEEMKRLQAKVFDETATLDEQQRFWELARTTGAVDEMMKTLEAKVKERPDDKEMRMQLAQSYIAKLLSIPGGPEQGIWSMKAEAQWKEVLKQDPEHWDARYSIAFNWSMWPDFLNKTPDAVREFEKLREVQERQAPDAKHGQTYLQLSRLYQKQGKSDKAKDVLRAGLGRHPDDAELKKALGSLEE